MHARAVGRGQGVAAASPGRGAADRVAGGGHGEWDCGVTAANLRTNATGRFVQNRKEEILGHQLGRNTGPRVAGTFVRVEYSAERGFPPVRSVGLLCADIVAKVENRATRKISRKLIFGLLRRCVAFQRHYGGPWSILDETIWSLTSPLVKRISGSKKFRSSPQKDFCNNIKRNADIAKFLSVKVLGCQWAFGIYKYTP